MENNTVKEFYEWLIDYRNTLQDSADAAEATTVEIIRIHYKNMFKL